MPRPTCWIKFDLDDWAADPQLQACSLAGQGLWLLVLRLAHRGNPYGYVRVGGHPIEPPIISRLVGRPLEEISPLLAELEEFGVFSRDEDGAIYSRRMVRDAEESRRGKETGSLGGNPALTGVVNRMVNGAGYRPGLDGGVNGEKRREEKRRGEARDPTTTTPSSEYGAGSTEHGGNGSSGTPPGPRGTTEYAALLPFAARYRELTGARGNPTSLAQQFADLARADLDDPAKVDLEVYASDATAALERAASEQCRPWSDQTPYRSHLRRELRSPRCFHRAIPELLEDPSGADPLEALHAAADAARESGQLGPEWRAQHGITLEEMGRDDADRFLTYAEHLEFQRNRDDFLSHEGGSNVSPR